ncbi:hypothetical protein PR048_002868 [Dryococelus australis]|uniref:Uncharacterized protein n=1 Tax=Dryococelus australis TaxID=614101 RepID=A0ABQ9ILG9_9NEOP|nr:hypothetical protein PR048_002868 [Dryococelus australis]
MLAQKAPLLPLPTLTTDANGKENCDNLPVPERNLVTSTSVNTCGGVGGGGKILPFLSVFILKCFPRVFPVGAEVVLWLDYLPPAWANQVGFPAESLPDFRMWESCRTMALIGGFSRGSPVFPRPFITALIHTHRLSRPRYGHDGVHISCSSFADNEERVPLSPAKGTRLLAPHVGPLQYLSGASVEYTRIGKKCLCITCFGVVCLPCSETYWKTDSIKACPQMSQEKFGGRSAPGKSTIWVLTKKLETKGTSFDMNEVVIQRCHGKL